jgi:hypothetical protein
MINHRTGRHSQGGEVDGLEGCWEGLPPQGLLLRTTTTAKSTTIAMHVLVFDLEE